MVASDSPVNKNNLISSSTIELQPHDQSFNKTVSLGWALQGNTHKLLLAGGAVVGRAQTLQLEERWGQHDMVTNWAVITK